MPRLIHLNGPPGIGKSTIARRWAAEHPGVLNCDIDLLRRLVGGSADDFAGAGQLIRPAALAMIGAYLAQGQDVVLPQMIAGPEETARFEAAATGVGAAFVEVFLMDTADAAVARFHRRGDDGGGAGGGAVDPWHDQVRRVVAEQGGDAVLEDYHRRLVALLDSRPAAHRVDSVEGDAEATYAAVVAAIGG